MPNRKATFRDIVLDTPQANHSPAARDLRAGELCLLCDLRSPPSGMAPAEGMLELSLAPRPKATFHSDLSFKAYRRRRRWLTAIVLLLFISWAGVLGIALLYFDECESRYFPGCDQGLLAIPEFRLLLITSGSLFLASMAAAAWTSSSRGGYPVDIELPKRLVEELANANILKNKIFSLSKATGPMEKAAEKAFGGTLDKLGIPEGELLGTIAHVFANIGAEERIDAGMLALREFLVTNVYRVWGIEKNQLPVWPHRKRSSLDKGASEPSALQEELRGLRKRLTLFGRKRVEVTHDGSTYFVKVGRVTRFSKDFIDIEREAWRL
jgi:hypothetical protein